MYAMVKFSEHPKPKVFGIGNVMDADNLLSMNGVEWIQVITSSGWAVRPHDETRYAPLVVHEALRAIQARHR